jgi:hypothetical protein
MCPTLPNEFAIRFRPNKTSCSKHPLMDLACELENGPKFEDWFLKLGGILP